MLRTSIPYGSPIRVARRSLSPLIVLSVDE
uniref:Uncharacterized protein n=1 Tax=Anopheles funestus TaxID=62324 RepID=A0A182S1X6_ANOFN